MSFQLTSYAYLDFMSDFTALSYQIDQVLKLVESTCIFLDAIAILINLAFSVMVAGYDFLKSKYYSHKWRSMD